MVSPREPAAEQVRGGTLVAARHVRLALALVRPVGWAAALACLAILASYVLGFERGYRPWPEGPGTSPLTAATLLLLAAGMAMHRPRHRSRPGQVLIAIASAIAILRMAEIAFGFSVLPGTSYLPQAGASPISFGWNSALGAALSGITILSTRRLGSAVVQLLAGFAIAVPMIAIVGYSYGLTAFYGRSSLYTAAILLMIATGATLATSQHGIVRVLFSPFVAGRLARRQLLGVVAIPYGTGLVLHYASPISAPAVFGMGIISTTLLMIVLMSTSLLALDELDRRRRRAERSAYYDATHDPLTGLANRRMFTEVAEIDLMRAAREGAAASLVMLDLDRFKSINDEFGHPAGDAVLKRASAAIKSNLRGGDLASRLGGEEFAIFLPDTPADAAIDLTERLLREIEQIDFSATLGPGRPVTISAGVACQGEGTEGLEALLAAADAALYVAKENGRNRVELAADCPAQVPVS